MKGFKGIAAYQERQRKLVMQFGMILLNPLSLHKSYIYDYDVILGCKKRFSSEFWDEYRGYKGNENPKVPKSVRAEICKRFADGLDVSDIIGTYTYKVKKANKEEVKEIYVGRADVFVYPVKYYFKRKSASEKQSINYP